MAKSIKLFSGLLVLILFSTVSKAETIIKCVDAAGHVTFTTMGCKASETNVTATAEAKAKAAEDAKEQAEAKADEEAVRQKRLSAMGGTNSTTTSTSNSTTTSSPASSSNTATTSQLQTTESGNKVGTRGSINGDLTVGYQP